MAAHQAPCPWDSPGKKTGVDCHFLLQCMRVKSESEVAQSCPTLCDTMGYRVHGILQARILEWVDFPFSRDFPNLGIKPRSLTLQANSLPAEPQEKPKNTGVGSLSLLQWIFLTQESNQGLLHCRCILYQLSYYGESMQALLELLLSSL